MFWLTHTVAHSFPIWNLQRGCLNKEPCGQEILPRTEAECAGGAQSVMKLSGMIRQIYGLGLSLLWILSPGVRACFWVDWLKLCLRDDSIYPGLPFHTIKNTATLCNVILKKAEFEETRFPRREDYPSDYWNNYPRFWDDISRCCRWEATERPTMANILNSVDSYSPPPRTPS